MNQTELNEILESHKKWVRGESDGIQANLSGANLSGANLFLADLPRAGLYGANLYGANLSGANLYGADLSGADLSRANLSRANLSGANLSGASLFLANLSGANLFLADLFGADLSGADLSRADLSGADLSGADLSGAKLSGAQLSADTKIEQSMLDRYFPIRCPSEGSFIGWKKAGDKIVKLLIPDDAIRLSAFGRKCRCNKAVVLRIEELDGIDSKLNNVCSTYDSNFVYVVGTTVYVDDFCVDRKLECASGIHFFITRQEAVNY